MSPSIRHSIIYMAGLCAFSFLTSNCSNDLELFGSGDPIPVVWCLLNPDSDEQYVRLGRSYMNDPANPGQPPVSDSTVWNLPVSVYVEEWIDGTPVKLFQFSHIDSPPKDSGYFPENNLSLFRSSFRPVRLSWYRLYVHFPDDDRIITGNTQIPGRPVILDPLEIPGRTINLQSGVQYTMRWTPAKGAGIYQGYFMVACHETIGLQESNFEVGIKLDPLLKFDQSILIESQASGVSFLSEFGRKVPVREGALRVVTGLQFRLYTGGEELALQVSPELQITTISSSLNQYTNLSRGIGLFSSLQLTTINNLELSRTTLNDIARSEQTKNLGFKDVHWGKQE